MTIGKNAILLFEDEASRLTVNSLLHIGQDAYVQVKGQHVVSEITHVENGAVTDFD